ncbi:Protein O-mannosyl-transferase TMTC4 (Transmembrane and TPR repeat-containing protein 4) [Durusdinium trenchii]|uniref:dolichyl-phosphate-mannose--protein mannosyltransferase n=1 Tax=Durusdinium trenchii TaxID=1381693 RepID=A0ABP0IDC0_9DINO
MQANGHASSTSDPARRRRVFSSLWPVLCCLLYAPCVTYSEWYIDELFAVLRNEDARGETSLTQVFSNDFWGNPLWGQSWTHKSYRPLAVLSFAWQFRFLGEELFRPQPLRTFNAAIHAGNSLLVWLLLRRLGLRNWASLASCLFAAHPVHVENIVYLVGRADVLATTGWLLAALAHLEVRRRWQDKNYLPKLSAVLLVLLCSLLAVAACLCKEMGLTLLVFTAGLELVSCKPGGRRLATGAISLAVLALTSFILLAVARFAVTQGSSAVFGYVDTPVQYHESFWVRSWSYLFQHSYYGKLLIFPGDLSWDYSFDALPVLRATWRDLRVLSVCTAYLSLFALISKGLANSRRMLLGLQVVVIPFVPASNLFFKVGVTIGERLLYPCTVGAALVLAALGQSFEKRHGRAWPRRLAVALLGVYLWRCGERVWQWRSSEALYVADALSWPTSVKTRHQLGTVLHQQGRYEEALLEFNASLTILDDNALTDHCIAQIYIETARYPLALERFEKILRGHGVGFSPFNLWMLYVDYGFTLVALGRFEEAIPALEKGLSRNAAVPHGQNALGYAFASLNQLQEAQDVLARGLEYDPENPVLWSNLAVVWMVAGAFQQAAQGLEKALTIEPENRVVIHNVMVLKGAAQSGYLTESPKLDLFFSRN